MGFSSVYRLLQEIFPQVDSRMLKAVAIEHNKDADAAVEVVLVEVLPNLLQQSNVVSFVSKNVSSPTQSEVNVDSGKAFQFQATVDSSDVTPCFRQQSSVASSSNSYGTSIALNDDSSRSIVDESSFYDAHDETEGAFDEVPALSEKFVDSNINNASINRSVAENVASFRKSVLSRAAVSGSIHEDDTVSLDAFVSTVNYINYIHLDVDTLKLDASTTALKYDDSVHTDVDIQTIVPSAINCETLLADTREFETTSENADPSEVEIVNSEDESNMAPVLTCSLQNCNTEHLEENIEDARSNKNALVSAMNSVVELMEEVENKEKTAEEVKVEAARCCSDIHANVVTQIKALRRAKEAYNMRAGEVRAEKAILASEMKELELRLFTLSDERSKSLEILEEMRKALEIRLSAALEEIRAAEEGKMEKAKLGREAILFQENQMEKVVEESNKLKLEAEENSKLQEFLMDRGRAIDILQGEFSVKFQDVLLLKEKFDKRIPLSRSLSSSGKSSILASSNSSFRSTSYRVDHEQETFETPRKGAELDDSYGFLENTKKYEVTCNYSPKFQTETAYVVDDRSPFVDEKRLKERKSLIEAEWELFENEDFVIPN